VSGWKLRPETEFEFLSPEEEMDMWWNVVVFALIGVLAGAAARMWYSGQRPLRILVTMLLGMIGAVLGGLLSWTVWPAVEGQLSMGGLLTSFLGAVLVLVMSAIVAYARSRSVPGERVP